MISIIASSILSNSIFVLFFLAVHFFKKQSVIKKVESKKLLSYSFLGILSFFLLLPIINCIQFGLDKLGYTSTSLNFSPNFQNIVLAGLFLAILPAICEELFFRASIFKLLEPYGKILSIILSAIFFALMHLSINQLVYPMLMGLLFGVIMYKENNIIYTITLHLINNILALILSMLNLNLFVNNILYYILATILFGVFVYIIAKLIISTKETEKRKLSKRALSKIVCVGLCVIVLWTIILFVG